ncbi:MAG TPA: cyclase family protein [Thermoanaerobaculia bacterium]|nr:cyclase family protein [Thermoanaerobaculia bacterium]
MRRFTFLASLLLAACASAPRPPIDLSAADVVDLTYAFDQKTLYWPNAPGGFELKRLAFGKTEGGYFYSANSFCAPEHGGTHLDAPIHFSQGALSVDQIPVRQLIAPAAVIDVTARAANDPDYRLTVADVADWEKRNGVIQAGTIVLLRTGWGSRYPDRKKYLGDDTPGATDKLHFPSYSEDSARYLVSNRHVGAIGVDTASIDYGQSKDFIVHQIANGANVPGLENIANLDRLPERGAWVIALPMKIAGGSGGPLRIVAVVPMIRR